MGSLRTDDWAPAQPVFGRGLSILEVGMARRRATHTFPASLRRTAATFLRRALLRGVALLRDRRFACGQRMSPVVDGPVARRQPSDVTAPRSGQSNGAVNLLWLIARSEC